MSAAEDFNKPAWGNAIDSDLDAIRGNLNFLLMIAAHGSVVVPGWQTTVTPDTSGATSDYSQPVTITLSRGTRRIYFHYVWNADGTVASIQMCYDDGVSSPGLSCFNPILIAYDDSGNLTTGVEDVLTRDLAAWFRFEEAGGLTRTDSVAGYVVTQSYAPNTGYDTGINGFAVDLERSSGGVYRSSTITALDGSTDFSISVWINVESHYTNGHVCSHGPTSRHPNDHNWYLEVESGAIIFAIANSGTWYTATHTATINTAQWYHIAVTYDATTQVLSLIVDDGTPVQTSSVPTSNGSTGALTVGGFGTIEGIDGLIDELAYWQRVITADEITQLATGITYTDI